MFAMLRFLILVLLARTTLTCYAYCQLTRQILMFRHAQKIHPCTLLQKRVLGRYVNSWDKEVFKYILDRFEKVSQTVQLQ